MIQEGQDDPVLLTWVPDKLRLSKAIGLFVQEKKFKIDFQNSGHDGHLEFQIGMILAICDQQVSLILTTKFLVNRPFGSGQ